MACLLDFSHVDTPVPEWDLILAVDENIIWAYHSVFSLESFQEIEFLKAVILARLVGTQALLGSSLYYFLLR